MCGQVKAITKKSHCSPGIGQIFFRWVQFEVNEICIQSTKFSISKQKLTN